MNEINWNESTEEINNKYSASVKIAKKGEFVKCISDNATGCSKGKEYTVVKSSSLTISVIDDKKKQHSYMLECCFFSDIYTKG
jgi:hypothetical protein